MFTDKKIIYTKRYNFHKAVEEYTNLELPDNEYTAEDKISPSQKFMRMMCDDCVHIINPTQIKAAPRFISRAKELSQTYEIDIDIFEDFYNIQVLLHIYCGQYTCAFAHGIAELLNMSNNVCFSITRSGPGDFALLLDYRTHDCYICGRKLD